MARLVKVLAMHARRPDPQWEEEMDSQIPREEQMNRRAITPGTAQQQARKINR